MAIVFNCPNGHQVSAGDGLAGKLGVCPDCGIKVRIPAAWPPETSPQSVVPPQTSPPTPPAETLVAPEEPQVPAPSETFAEEPVRIQTAPASNQSRVQRVLQRRKSERSAALWVLGLVVITVIVFGALIFVLLR